MLFRSDETCRSVKSLENFAQNFDKLKNTDNSIGMVDSFVDEIKKCDSQLYQKIKFITNITISEKV